VTSFFQTDWSVMQALYIQLIIHVHCDWTLLDLLGVELDNDNDDSCPASRCLKCRIMLGQVRYAWRSVSRCLEDSRLPR
jgi:hypothetical protein